MFDKSSINKLIKVLKEEKNSIDYNLKLNKALVEKSERKKFLMIYIINLLEALDKEGDCLPDDLKIMLQIKKAEQPLFNDFIRNCQNNIEILNKLKELKESELNNFENIKKGK